MSLYRFSRQADSDLEEITNYIAGDNPTAAVRVLEKFHETLFAHGER